MGQDGAAWQPRAAEKTAEDAAGQGGKLEALAVYKRLAHIIQGKDPLARDALKKALEGATEPVRVYAAALMEDGPSPDAAVATGLSRPVAEVVASREGLRAILARIRVDASDDRAVGVPRVDAVRGARRRGYSRTVRRVLVVTSDIPAAAAICAALHGERVTVYLHAPSPRAAFALVARFDATLCDATTEIVEFLVSEKQHSVQGSVALLATSGSDPNAAERLRGTAFPVIPSGDDGRIRAFVHGR